VAPEQFEVVYKVLRSIRLELRPFGEKWNASSAPALIEQDDPKRGRIEVPARRRP
jgi:hypothetical protein